METNQLTSGAADTPAGVSEAPKAQKAKTGGDAAGFYCYIGPSITGLIQHGAVYPGTRKTALAAAGAAIRHNPLIRTLIVSGDRLPEARLKAKQPGNALYQNYQRVAGRA